MSRNPARKKLAVLAVLSAMALVVLDAGLINVALPTIAEALDETPARSVLVVSAYQIGLLAGLLPSAHLADRVGYRRLFVIGVVIFACSAILSATAPTLPLIIAARGLQGLGGAAVMSLGIALLRLALGADRLPAAIGWNALVVAICSGLAPAVGALALSFASWRWLFVLALPLAAIALAAARDLPAHRPTSRSVDAPAMMLFAAAAGGMFVAIEVARSALIAAVAIGMTALLSGLWLLTRERGKEAPLLPLDLLALRPFRRSVATSVLFFVAQSGGLLALPFYLQLSHGKSVATTGLVIALWPSAVAATSRAANRLADRFGCEFVCAAGASVLAIGLMATAIWPVDQSIAPLAGCALICGIGFGLFQVPNNRNMFLAAPEARSAAAGGLQGTARLAGQTAGALLVAFVLSAVPLAVAPRVALGLAALAALMAAFASWPWTGRSTGPHSAPLRPPASAVPAGEAGQ